MFSLFTCSEVLKESFFEVKPTLDAFISEHGAPYMEDSVLHGEGGSFHAYVSFEPIDVFCRIPLLLYLGILSKVK